MFENHPTFEFILTGYLETSEAGEYFITSDNSRFRFNRVGKEWPQGVYRWNVIPSTESTGIISLLTLQEVYPVTEEPPSDICRLVGRVTTLSKRNNLVLLKINRPEEKTLRLTIANPTAEMAIGTQWQILAHRQGNQLVIQQAFAWGEEKSAERVPVSDSQTVTTVSREKQPPTALALEALKNQTGLMNWQLNKPVKRGLQGWEWEATEHPSQQRARVRISPKGLHQEVFVYPRYNQPPNHELAQNNLSVTPLGAARGIGASCFRVIIGPYEVILDCGTRPKGAEPLPALEYIANPDLLIISHAHQDHLGAVPVFHRQFPGTPMICTPGTREIAHIMLSDCLKVIQREDSPALFDQEDLERTLFHLETQPIGVDFEPLPDLKVRFIHAGHILGAACIYLRYGERSLFYTGDYNTAASRTTEGLKLNDLPQADILVTESTYGADLHPSRKTQETNLMNAIAEITEAGGNVLIPAFALGRAQEILLAIRTSHLFQKNSVPVYVDGLVRAVTDTFRENIELLPMPVQNLFRNSNVEPFYDEKGLPPIIPINHHRERPLAIAKPSVIVASSGMLTGGASVYYASILLERENAAIFISGYTDEESPGRLLQNLRTGDRIELDGKQIEVKAQVRKFNLSAHADKTGLCQVINRVNPKHLVLIHGSKDALHELARAGELENKYFIHIPEIGETIEYGSAPIHLSEEKIATLEMPVEFEINIEAEVDGAWLRIPASIVEDDPRWKLLSANGILRAKWDGFHLKLSPLTQYHIALESALNSDKNCCAVCQFFSKGVCRNEESPLHTLQVAPSAECPEFIKKT